jgi:hypothetical protein
LFYVRLFVEQSQQLAMGVHWGTVPGYHGGDAGIAGQLAKAKRPVIAPRAQESE